MSLTAEQIARLAAAVASLNQGITTGRLAARTEFESVLKEIEESDLADTERNALIETLSNNIHNLGHDLFVVEGIDLDAPQASAQATDTASASA